LQLQLEAIESGELAPNMSIHTDGKDVFEKLATKIRQFTRPPSANAVVADSYMYYRAQTIISRKVLKELKNIDRTNAKHIFNEEAFSHVVDLYTNFKSQSEMKMKNTAIEHPSICNPLAASLAKCTVHKIEEIALHELFERQLITPKLFINLKEEMLKAK
jgi:hypothetical protein